MAILRTPEGLDNTVNYVATFAFFCCISCVSLMLKFGGFKASLNIFNGKRNSKDHDVLEHGLCLNGAYRTNKDEYFGNDRVLEPPKRLTPSMVKLPNSQQNTPAIRPTKSSNDLTKQNNLPAHLRYSTPSVSLDPRGEDERAPRTSQNGRQNTPVSPHQEKEQAKVKKKQLAEQKARDKLATQERAKQEKLTKAKEKKEAKEKASKGKKDKKAKAPAPPPMPPPVPISTSVITPANVKPSLQPSNYSTNTLDSSISRSSGPPPYSKEPIPAQTSLPKPEMTQNGNDPSGNITFSKPIDTGSWDMVSKHREQISRTTITMEAQNKQRVMDLNYNINKRDNSDA